MIHGAATWQALDFVTCHQYSSDESSLESLGSLTGQIHSRIGGHVGARYRLKKVEVEKSETLRLPSDTPVSTPSSWDERASVHSEIHEMTREELKEKIAGEGLTADQLWFGMAQRAQGLFRRKKMERKVKKVTELRLKNARREEELRLHLGRAIVVEVDRKYSTENDVEIPEGRTKLNVAGEKADAATQVDRTITRIPSSGGGVEEQDPDKMARVALLEERLRDRERDFLRMGRWGHEPQGIKDDQFKFGAVGEDELRGADAAPDDGDGLDFATWKRELLSGADESPVGRAQQAAAPAPLEIQETGGVVGEVEQDVRQTRDAEAPPVPGKARAAKARAAKKGKGGKPALSPELLEEESFRTGADVTAHVVGEEGEVESTSPQGPMVMNRWGMMVPEESVKGRKGKKVPRSPVGDRDPSSSRLPRDFMGGDMTGISEKGPIMGALEREAETTVQEKTKVGTKVLAAPPFPPAPPVQEESKAQEETEVQEESKAVSSTGTPPRPEPTTSPKPPKAGVAGGVPVEEPASKSSASSSKRSSKGGSSESEKSESEKSGDVSPPQDVVPGAAPSSSGVPPSSAGSGSASGTQATLPKKAAQAKQKGAKQKGAKPRGAKQKGGGPAESEPPPSPPQVDAVTAPPVPPSEEQEERVFAPPEEQEDRAFVPPGDEGNFIRKPRPVIPPLALPLPGMKKIKPDSDSSSSGEGSSSEGSTGREIGEKRGAEAAAKQEAKIAAAKQDEAAKQEAKMKAPALGKKAPAAKATAAVEPPAPASPGTAGVDKAAARGKGKKGAGAGASKAKAKASVDGKGKTGVLGEKAEPSAPPGALSAIAERTEADGSSRGASGSSKSEGEGGEAKKSSTGAAKAKPSVTDHPVDGKEPAGATGDEKGGPAPPAAASEAASAKSSTSSKSGSKSSSSSKSSGPKTKPPPADTVATPAVLVTPAAPVATPATDAGAADHAPQEPHIPSEQGGHTPVATLGPDDIYETGAAVPLDVGVGPAARPEDALSTSRTGDSYTPIIISSTTPPGSPDDRRDPAASTAVDGGRPRRGPGARRDGSSSTPSYEDLPTVLDSEEEKRLILLKEAKKFEDDDLELDLDRFIQMADEIPLPFEQPESPYRSTRQLSPMGRLMARLDGQKEKQLHEERKQAWLEQRRAEKQRKRDLEQMEKARRKFDFAEAERQKNLRYRKEGERYAKRQRRKARARRGAQEEGAEWDSEEWERREDAVELVYEVDLAEDAAVEESEVGRIIVGLTEMDEIGIT